MKYRKFAVFLSVCNLAMMLVSLQYEAKWVKRVGNESSWSGLWDLCFVSKNFTVIGVHVKTIDVEYYEHQLSICHSRIEYIQKAVIGALIAAVGSGFIGTMLSIAGFITSSFYKKYYYLHSAAEFFLVSGITILLTVIAYPLSVRHYLSQTENILLGYGYILCWTSSALYFLEFYIMMLDEFCSTPVTDNSSTTASNTNVIPPSMSKCRQSISNNKDLCKSGSQDWV